MPQCIPTQHNNKRNLSSAVNSMHNYIHVYVNEKIVTVETILGMGGERDKGKQ
jgi:hypothetical protein